MRNNLENIIHLRTGFSGSEVLLNTIDEIQVTHQARPVLFTSSYKTLWPSGWIDYEPFSDIGNDCIWLLHDECFDYQHITDLYPFLLKKNITLYFISQSRTWRNLNFNAFDPVLRNHIHYVHFQTVEHTYCQIVKSLRYTNVIGKQINLETLKDKIYIADFNDDIIINTYADLSEMDVLWDVANLTKVYRAPSSRAAARGRI